MSNKVSESPHRNNPVWILILSLFLIAGILIETLPSFLVSNGKLLSAIRELNQVIGISQGDWPLFAPNPVLNNGMVVAEVEDSQNRLFIWSSRNWSECSAWEKFYRFRYMNYHQRVVNNIDACNDLADYLLHAIPTQEKVESSIQFDAQGTIRENKPIQPPIRSLRLYKHRNEISILTGEPLPTSEEIMWNLQSTFLCQREPEP